MIHFFEIQPHDRDYYTRALKKYAVAEHAQTLNEHTVEWAREAEVISVFVHSPITVHLLDQLPRLRHIITRSVGMDHIDRVACEKKGIRVWNIRDYGPHTVAEHTFALMLGMVRTLPTILHKLESHQYYVDPETNRELKGMTLGIVGTGLIGTEVAQRAHAFGMKIVASDHGRSRQLERLYGVRFTSFKEVLKQADILTLHIPLTPENRHVINASTLRLMKRSAFLINTARGGLVDSQALLTSLKKERLAGAGLDVLEGEAFIFPEHPLIPRSVTEKKELATARALIRHPKVLVTPHIAFGSKESIQRIREKTVSILTEIYGKR